MYRVSPFVRHFAWALLGGAAVATLWVNLDPSSYYDAVEWRLADVALPSWLAAAPINLTAQAFVGNVLMALFLAFIAKELWEALVLEKGALAGRHAIMPLAITIGAVAGAAVFWIALSNLFQSAEEALPGMGWYIPAASDVVLCYVIGRYAFGINHPALHVLLLVSIAGDVAALMLHGLFSPESVLRPWWLMLSLAAALLVWRLYGRRPAADATEQDRQRLRALWPYVPAGLLCWVGVAAAGLPPALGLLPIVPAIAHADRTFGIFAEAEHFLQDPLNRLAHALVLPVAVVLFLFGLAFGGIDFSAFAPTTVILLGALWIGKPLGILAAAIATGLVTGQRLPKSIGLRDLMLVALILSMSFTVPALMLDPGLPGGNMREAARLALAISLLAGPLAILIARSRR